MSRVQLTASQLDRIEDALEGLEDLGLDDPLLAATDEESRVVAEHLDAYRQILVLTRDALPLQDAPVGALDGVIAEAHASVAPGAADVQAVAATPAEGEKSWWQRLSAAVWVPALGFAGAAALLLLVMQPGADEPAPTVAQAEPEDLGRRADGAAGAAALKEEASRPERDAPMSTILEEGRLADSVPGSADAEEDLRAAGVERRPRVRERNEDGVDPFAAADARDKTDEDGDAPGIALGGAVGGSKSGKSGGASSSPLSPPKPVPNAAPKKNKTSSKSTGLPGTTKSPSGPPADPAPEPEPSKPAELDDEEKQKDGGGTKQDAKNTGKKEEPAVDPVFFVKRGEKARKLGKCSAAKLDFNKAKASPDGKVRARALAGLGLCALAAGQDATAESLFAQARTADASIASFISSERKAIEGPPAQAQEQTQD